MLLNIIRNIQPVLTILLCGSAFHFGIMMRLGLGVLPMATDGGLLITTTFYASFAYILIKLLYSMYTVLMEVIKIHDNLMLGWIYTITIFIMISISVVAIEAYIIVHVDFRMYKSSWIMIVSFLLAIFSVSIRKVSEVISMTIASVAAVVFCYYGGVLYVDLNRDYGGGVNIFLQGDEKPRIGTVMFPVGEGYIIYFPGDQFYRYVPERRIEEIGIPISR